MTHVEARELLLDLAYGELPAERAAEVELHVAGCADCTQERAEVAGMRRAASALGEMEEPSAGFDDPCVERGVGVGGSVPVA